MKDIHKGRYYILAILTVFVWSSTFISTKVLLNNFTPVEILVYRFALAYLLMFIVYPKFHKPESIKTELKIMFAGISGGTLYFLGENFALHFSLASNVSLLVSTAPIITLFLAHFLIQGEQLSRKTMAGAAIAFSGVALVIFNGNFILKLNPIGDLLALSSAFAWSIYTITIRTLKTKYSPYYITRKIFFYTVLAMIPVIFFSPVSLNFTPLLHWKTALNLLFLTVFASCGAYVAWTKVIWAIGVTKANTFIYFIPLLTLILSALILSEPLTSYALGGALLIFSGVYVGSHNTKKAVKK